MSRLIVDANKPLTNVNGHVNTMSTIDVNGRLANWINGLEHNCVGC